MINNKKIFLVAPSFGCTTEPYLTRLKTSIKNFKKLNYEVIKGPNIFKAKGVVSSNTPKLRAQEIMDAFDSDANIIMSVGGGELMCEILPYIDFNKIKNNAHKIFIGFSDNTNLTFTLTTINNMQTIYGANAPSFYSLPLEYDTRDVMKLLDGIKKLQGYPKWELVSSKSEDNPLAPLNLTETKQIITHNYTKPFSGILLGGCLDCLVSLCGTRFDKVKEYIKDKDIIWFLEACDLNPLGIRRAIFQLKEAGWFSNVKGFLIGRPLCHDQNIMGVDKYNALDILKEYHVPILFDIDLGHLAPSMPFITGAKATISIINGNIEVEYL